MSNAVAECAVEIARSPEDVFDYVSDISREFEWNPHTKRVAKMTDGPIGTGTRWKGEWIAGDPMLIEYVAFDRPTRWRSIGRSRGLTVVSDGRVEAAGDGARLTVHFELEPHGLLRLIGPLLGRIMRGRESQNLAAIKARLERGAASINGGGQQ